MPMLNILQTTGAVSGLLCLTLMLLYTKRKLKSIEF